jgi:hypothetical protein
MLAMVAWLGFLVQPCASAVPLVGNGEMGRDIELSVVTHHGPGNPAGQCLHCVGATSGRNLLPDDCDGAAAASQAPAAKPLDSGEDGWSPALPAANSPVIERPAHLSVDMCRTGHLPRPVSLTVVYCVFLE